LKNKVIYIFVIFLLLFNFESYSQDFTIKFNNINNFNRVATAIVIKEGPKGYIWVGTQRGLLKYDGENSKNYTHNKDDPGSIPDNYVSTIFVSKSNELWVGTDGGLAKYIPTKDSFETYQFPHEAFGKKKSPVITSITESADSTFWIGTWGSGLVHLDIKKQTFNLYKNDPLDENSISDNKIYTAVEDSSGIIWIGTRSGGLNKLDKQSGRITRFLHSNGDDSSISHNRVYSLLFDSEQNLWVGTRGGGLNLLNRNKNGFVRFRYSPNDENSISNDNVMAIHEDQFGSIWVATNGGGLNQLNIETNKFIRYQHNPQNSDGISSNDLWSISPTKKGLIWLAHFTKGTSWFDPKDRQFGFIDNKKGSKSGLTEGIVKSIFKSSKGSVWVGTSHGLNRFNQNSNMFESMINDPNKDSTLSNNTVNVIFEDSIGQYWIGTNAGGLNLYNEDENSFSHYIHTPGKTNSLTSNVILSIQEDANKRLWIGTDRGLNFIDLERNSMNPVSTKLAQALKLVADFSINSIYISNNNLLWLGTISNGLILLNVEELTIKSFTKNNGNDLSLSHNRVFSILPEGKDILWIGTEEGLNKLNTRTLKFENHKFKERLSKQRISFLAIDKTKNLWIGGNGIFTLNRATEAFIKVGYSAGCIGVSQGASFQAKDGELFFGGVGYCHFYPDKLDIQVSTPKLVLTDFLLLNKRAKISEDSVISQHINYVKEIKLDYLDQVLSFEFALLNQKDFKGIMFKYRMIGLSEQWIDADPNYRIASFTGLPSGNYQFQVKGKTTNSKWSEIKTVNIFIAPPIWRSWWAYSLYIFIVILIMFYFISSSRRKLKYERKLNQQMEETINTRTNQLRNANLELEKVVNNLEEISFTDQLTKIHNRHFFSEYIPKEIAKLIRGDNTQNSTKLVFFMIDVDHFKKVNDTYGHDAGDEVLIGLAQQIQSTCRNSDIAVRWGGEEFVVVGNFKTFEEITIFAERIRKNIEQFTFQISEELSLKVTCSIGIATFPFNSMCDNYLTWEQTLNLSDQALYLVKRNGRNGWVCLKPNELTPAEDLYDLCIKDIKSAIKENYISVLSSISSL